MAPHSAGIARPGPSRPAGKFVNNPGGEGIDRHLTGAETLAFQARITDLQKLPRAREGLVDALDEQVLISATLDAPRAGKALPWCLFREGSPLVLVPARESELLQTPLPDLLG